MTHVGETAIPHGFHALITPNRYSSVAVRTSQVSGGLGSIDYFLMLKCGAELQYLSSERVNVHSEEGLIEEARKRLNEENIISVLRKWYSAPQIN